jgi:radical SAM protein with 4Fe4S-binding SPASM domain
LDWTQDGAMAATWQAANRVLKAQLDVTYRCDLACQHCYLDDRETWPELTTAEWRSVLDQLADLGALRLSWSGGDPSQRADFGDLLTYARQLGFDSTVRTHGGAITPALALEWKDLWVRKVIVSLYSLQPAIHDAFTRRDGSLAATLRGVDAARAAGLVVELHVVLQADTIAEIPALAAYGAARGCVVLFQDTVARDNAARNDLDTLRLSPDEVLQARRLIAQVQPPTKALRPQLADRPGSVPCYAGRTAIYISPDGAVWPCVTWPMALGHLRESSLSDIWHQSERRKEILAWTNDNRTACQSCAGSSTCFYCAGEAYKTTGDYRQAPPEFHARTRARLIAMEEAGHLTLTSEQWATLPASDFDRPPVTDQPTKMYRPTRGKAVRVHQLALGQPSVNRR